MKFFIMFGAIILAVLMGMLPSIDKQKKIWWKAFVVVMVAFAIIFTLLPPVAGNITSIALLQRGFEEDLNIEFIVNEDIKIEDDHWIMPIDHQYDVLTEKLVISNEEQLKLISKAETFLGNVTYNEDEHKLYLQSIEDINPGMLYPFVPNLAERIRILNLHVPLAWICVVAYLISMVYSIRYLKTKEFEFDTKAAASAALGTLFAILATVTGMLWAKYNWGSYWNWDPRQTSILFLILIYAAYFALRSAIDNHETKAKLSAVYAIIAFVTVPFLVFILPRLTGGLHPGSADDVNAGPVISKQGSALDSTMIYSFGVSLFAFTMLFFWMLNIHIRYKLEERKRQKIV